MDERKNDNFEEKSYKRWREKLSGYYDLAILCFFLVAACVLFAYLLFHFDIVKSVFGIIISVVSPVIVGFVFAFLLNPLVMVLESKFFGFYNRHKKAAKKSKEKADGEKCDDNAEVTNQNFMLTDGRKGARRAAIFVTVICVVTAVGLLIMAVIPALARSIASLAEKLPGYYNTVSDAIINFVNKHEWLSKNIPDVNEVLNKINIFDAISEYINSILSTAYNGVVIMFKIVYNVLVGLIISIYLLGGKERYIGQVKKVVFAIMKPKKAKVFIQTMSKTNKIFRSAIIGKILDSIIIGFLCFIGMSILGMVGFEAIGDNRVLLSVVVGVTNVIQFFGPYIGGIPSVFLVFCESPVQGLIFAIFIVVLQQFDCNFLDPKIVGTSVGLSPIYVLVACITGGGLFGLPGMLIATPTAAVLYGLIKSWAESRLEEKNLPTDTKEYAKKPGAVLYEQSRANSGKAD